MVLLAAVLVASLAAMPAEAADADTGTSVDLGDWSSPPEVVLSVGQVLLYDTSLSDYTMTAEGDGLKSEGGFLGFEGNVLSGTADEIGTYTVHVEAFWADGEDVFIASQTLIIEVVYGNAEHGCELFYRDGWHQGLFELIPDDYGEEYAASLDDRSTGDRIFQEGVAESQTLSRGFSTDHYKISSPVAKMTSWHGLTINVELVETTGYQTIRTTIEGTPNGGTDGETANLDIQYTWSYDSGTEHTNTMRHILVYATSITTTIAFDANGGAEAPASIVQTTTKDPGSTIYTFTIPAGTPIRDGWDFYGWGTSSTWVSEGYDAGKKVQAYAGTTTTYYAVWGKTATLKFDMNGGSLTYGRTMSDMTAFVTPSKWTAGAKATLTIPTDYMNKADHHFVGWSTNPESTTAEYAQGSTIEVEYGKTVTLHAIWRLDDKDLNFVSGDGGSVDTAKLTAKVGATFSVSGSSLTITNPDGTKVGTVTATPDKGFIFAGWNDVPDVLEKTSKSTITATFTESTVETHTVTLTAGSGGSVSASSMTVPAGSVISASGNVLTFTYDGSTVATVTATPDDGCSFSSWSRSSGTVTSDISISATFASGYTVTLNAGSHGSVGTASVTASSGTVCTIASDGSISFKPASGGNVTVSSVALTIDTGYRFAGWYTDSSYQTAWTSGKAITGDTSLYAKLEPLTYTVSVTASPSDGGSISRGSMTDVPYGSTYRTYNNTFAVTIASGRTGNTYSFVAEAADGYTFSGWSVSSSGKITGDLDVKANFISDSVSTCMVSLPGSSGGWMSNSSIAVPAGSSMKVSGNSLVFTSSSGTMAVEANPNDGYALAGWTTDSSASTPMYTDGQTVNGIVKEGTLTLYAVWVRTYTVTFDANADDATGTMADESFVPGTAKQLTRNGFSRSGYTFAGWALSADAAKAQYTDGQSVVDLSVGGSKVTLYAVWTAGAAASFTVTFYDEKGQVLATQTVASGDSAEKLDDPAGGKYLYYSDAEHTRSYLFRTVTADASVYVVYKETVLKDTVIGDLTMTDVAAIGTAGVGAVLFLLGITTNQMLSIIGLALMGFGGCEYFGITGLFGRFL